MKKTVVIEILLVAVFAVLLSCAIIALKDIPSMKEYIDYFNTLPSQDANYEIGFIVAANTEIYVRTYLSIGIPALIAAVADLAAIVIIAIKDLPVFKPLINKLSTKFAARKEYRATAKAEQAATAKQERIEKLQAELDELKKDE